MKRLGLLLVLLFVTARLGAADQPLSHAGCAAMGGDTVEPALLERPIAMRKDIGSVHQKVTTSSSEAQAFYDQGLTLLHHYAFIDAARSFRQALRSDPDCAMCWMGLGPGLGDYSSAEALSHERPELLSLRERLVERYREAFDRVFVTPTAREQLGDFDYDLALAQLIGPVVFTKLATLPSLDHAACERIVDDFLAARGCRPVRNGPRAVPTVATDESP